MGMYSVLDSNGRGLVAFRTIPQPHTVNYYKPPNYTDKGLKNKKDFVD